MKYSSVFLQDGLSIDDAHGRYSTRRRALAKTVAFPVVLYGVQQNQTSVYPWLMTHTPLFQDPLVHFFTGINQKKTALLMDPVAKKETLFLPQKDMKKEFWDGAQLGVGNTVSEKEAKVVSGIKHVALIDTLLSEIVGALKLQNADTLGLFWYETPKGKPEVKDDFYAFKRQCRRYLNENGCSHVAIENIAPLVWPLRLKLDDTDIRNMRKANQLTAQSLEAVYHEMPRLSSEQEVAGKLAGELLSKSSMGLSFPSIIASGKNAATLHYHKNDEPLAKNGLLLIDCGLRYNSMPADISRTIPVNGTFNPLQKLLYTIVLKAQLKVEKMIKPGITVRELNTVCWSSIESDLDVQFTQKGGKMTRAYETTPHNVSHLIGLMVHDGDPYRMYRDDPLRPGMIISNEPGLYGEFEITLDGKHYKEPIGIRIEDDILITETGSRNLSKGCIKTVEELEAALQGRH